MFKKVLKGIAIVMVSIVLLGMIAFGFLYYDNIGKFETDTEKYPHSVGYIDQSKALKNDTYDLCNSDQIIDLHSPRHLKVYEGSKRVFRKSVLKAFDSTAYKDSGYVNFRFIVNCKGQPGWFEIRQTDLIYEKTTLDEDLVNALLEITAKPEHWSIRSYDTEVYNYYMYITYRIENGKISEILP